MYVIDASVWVSRFLIEDINHIRSDVWIESLLDSRESILEPLLLLPEVAGAVARRTGLAERGIHVAYLIERMSIVRLYPVDSALAELGTRLAADLRLRGSDAVYVALAHRLNAPLVTWDREQLDRGRSAAQMLTPIEAMTT